MTETTTLLISQIRNRNSFRFVPFWSNGTFGGIA